MSEPAKDRAGRRRRGPRAPGAAKKTAEGAEKLTSEVKQEPLDSTAALSELFPDWTQDDLQMVLQESQNDVAEAVRRITEGIAMKSVQVKSKREVRERREQELKEAAREAREASRRENRTKEPKAAPAAAQRKQPTPTSTSHPSASSAPASHTQASSQPLPQLQSLQSASSAAAAPVAAPALESNGKAVATPASAPVNGKMSWAKALSQRPEPVQPAAQATKPVESAEQKGSAGEAPATLPKAPAKAPAKAPTRETVNKDSGVTAAQDAASTIPARPDGKISWAGALAPKRAPKPEPQPSKEETATAAASAPADKKKEKKEKKSQDSKPESSKDQEDQSTESKDKKSDRGDKKKNSRGGKKKETSPNVGEVTKKMESLDLPRGPAAEQAQSQGRARNAGSPEKTQQQKQPSPKANGAAPGSDVQDAQQAAAAAAHQQQQQQMQQQQQQLQQQQQQMQQQSQRPQQPKQQQPQQPQQPQAHEMPPQMMFNPYMTQYGMPPPPMAGNMTPYAMQMPQGQQGNQAQQPQMPGMTMPMIPAMPAMTPAHGSAPSPSMPPQTVLPQSVPAGQDYSAYLAQYNAYGFPPRGYDYGYDQNAAAAYMYPPYSYNAYAPAPHMSQPMVPSHPDSPASQQKPMYWQGGQYGQQQYYDPNMQQRHWSEYNQ